jgi:hypothetical protein
MKNSKTYLRGKFGNLWVHLNFRIQVGGTDLYDHTEGLESGITVVNRLGVGERG